MFNFQKCFEEQNSNIIEHNGLVYHRFFSAKVTTCTTLSFRFISSSSMFEQAIVIAFPRGFAGDVRVNGKHIPIRKTAFPKLNFWESTSLRSFDVTVMGFQGEIKICNGSDPTGTKQFCKCLSDGCAMVIENLTENKFRFHCNDHQFDDDCNDLVFDLQLTET